jgi:predicted dehydrogenase
MTIKYNNIMNIGIIGSGYISDSHIKVIKNNKKFKILGIYSRTINNARIKAEKYNIKYFSNNLDIFINKFKYDGIIVLVSADKIYEITKLLLKYKIPILIEKPAGLNLKELNSLIKKNKKYKTPNMIALNRRYYSIFKKLKKIMVKKNKLRSFIIEGHENFWNIKKIVKKNKILENWEYANSIHTVDLINFFGDSEITNFYKINNKIKEFHNVTSILKFKNGINCTYISNWNSPSRYSVKLFTDKYTYLIKPLEKCYQIDHNFKQKEILPDKNDIKFKAGFSNQLRNFENLIKSKKNIWPDSNLNKTLETYKLVNKIYN